MNVDKAVSFILQEGNRLERARLAHLMENRPVSEDELGCLLIGQRPDGGWAPFWADDYSSLDATCFHLVQAEQLGVPHVHPAMTRIARFLVGRQASDGSWEEEPYVASSAPPWAKPGDLPSRLYLTANCGFRLTVLAGSTEASLAAAGHLRAHLDEQGRLPASWQAHWLAAGLWVAVNWTEPADRVLSTLHAQVSSLPVSNLAWLAITLLEAGMSPEHPVLLDAAARLEDGQAAEGRWPSEDGPDWDVHSTIEALGALRLCGRF